MELTPFPARDVCDDSPAGVDCSWASCLRVLCPPNTSEVLGPDFSSKAAGYTRSLGWKWSLGQGVTQTAQSSTACSVTAGAPGVGGTPGHVSSSLSFLVIKEGGWERGGSCRGDVAFTILSQLLTWLQRTRLRGQSSVMGSWRSLSAGAFCPLSPLATKVKLDRGVGQQFAICLFPPDVLVSQLGRWVGTGTEVISVTVLVVTSQDPGGWSSSRSVVCGFCPVSCC